MMAMKMMRVNMMWRSKLMADLVMGLENCVTAAEYRSAIFWVV